MRKGNGLTGALETRVRRFVTNLTFAFRQEGWQSYVKSRAGVWRKIKLPHGAWQATFCADPFLFRHDEVNWLFVETMTLEGKGVIGCLKEVDEKWVWQGVVLEEPCHLSYPQVFEEGGRVYMIPESCNRNPGDVSLYEAVEFPTKWKKVKRLIERPFADATILKRNGHWYMACYNLPPDEHAEIWHSEYLLGPWVRHPMYMNINQSRRLMRCGGRFIVDGWKIYRIAQDCNGYYGKRLFRVEVSAISPDVYCEDGWEVLADRNMPPLGMKHTYNELIYNGQKICVVDIHRDVFRPMSVILERLASAIVKKMRRK